jgi:hypothetical protein
MIAVRLLTGYGGFMIVNIEGRFVHKRAAKSAFSQMGC